MKRLLFAFLALLLMSEASAQITCTPFFTWSQTPTPSSTYRITFTLASTFSNLPSGPIKTYQSINFGVGGAFGIPPGNTGFWDYPGAGNYTVTLTTYVIDSITQQVLCTNNYSQVVVVTQPACIFTLSSVSNGGGSYTINIGNNSPGLTYTCNFGDGTTATGTSTSFTHTYSFSGFYPVLVTSSGGNCSYSDYTYISYTGGPLLCSQLSAGFQSSVGYLGAVSFYNSSTYVYHTPPVSMMEKWDFGDGSPVIAGNSAPTHTYAAAGVYTVTLINEWRDSTTQTVLCTDTAVGSLTVTMNPLPNYISGHITGDTGVASYKIWLIVHDAQLNTLTAVDSVTTQGSWGVAGYQFDNHPAGNYLLKAAPLNTLPGSTWTVPTYHDSSLYWNTASLIAHGGTGTTNIDVYLRHGIVTSGPGFIGGNISLGANKGTNVGVPDLLVMLRNSAGQLVKYTYTDVNGDYSFSSLAAGTYSVYPEGMNYLTTPSSAITLAMGQYNVGGINFKQTPTEIKPISTGIAGWASNSMFRIYPNPSKGKVMITGASAITGHATVQVTDMTGREVYVQLMDPTKDSSIDLASLQPGVYFIRIATDKAQHTEKVILQR